jgi:DNA-binding SARP family transcriptional activator
MGDSPRLGLANAVQGPGGLLMTASTPAIRLQLLGSFQLLVDDRVVPVTSGAQRLIAFLALQDGRRPRGYVAGALWPEVPTGRANANLRAGLWRLSAPCRLLVDQSSQDVGLAASVAIDHRAAVARSQRLLDRSTRCAESDLDGTARLELSRALLPTWYDDEWVLVERERFHQLRLHALEALCERLTAVGRYGEAIDAAMAAVVAEPLRESAHRVLIKAYLAEGNRGEADRQYELCRHLLREELGVQPSTALRELVIRDRRVLIGAVTPQ